MKKEERRGVPTPSSVDISDSEGHRTRTTERTRSLSPGLLMTGLYSPCISLKPRAALLYAIRYQY